MLYLSKLFYQIQFVESIEIIRTLFEENPSVKLLDCGCGDGQTITKVTNKLETKESFGIDIVDKNVEEAKTNGIKAVKSDLNRPFPFQDESFDVVHANEVIEHLCDTDMFLKEVYRVLKLGGYFIVSTCNLAAFHNIFFLLLGRQPPPADVSDEFQVGVWNAPMRKNASGPCHRRMFTLRALEGLLECHGFKVEKSVGAGFYPLPIKLAKVMCRLDKKHSAYITVKESKAK